MTHPPTPPDISSSSAKDQSPPQVLLVGTPNVGKSALFNRLTGHYVTVSNYPGTTVEISRGHLQRHGRRYEIIDTPGMYSLLPISAEEGIARQVLFSRPWQLVIHVIDAKNINRMLGLTLQLAEAGCPLVLAVNMMDEARRVNLQINFQRLSDLLGLPVLPLVSITGEGLDRLLQYVEQPPPPPPLRIRHAEQMECAISALAARLPEHPAISRRLRALLLLQGDREQRSALLRELDDCATAALLQEISHWRAGMPHSPHYQSTLAINRQVEHLLATTVAWPREPSTTGLREKIDRFCRNPVTGTLLLLAVLYLGFYKLVGTFGAGTLVDFIEHHLFETRLIPWTEWLTEQYVPWPALRDLICGEYGLVTLGLRYAIAIILPIVGMFFAVFAVMEDTGYLPRLAMLTDRIFKRLGLNGRAVIPIVLGFGCDTMATIVTRTLETTRERIIATILLALAIPCSAQLGVILALLAAHPGGLALWALFITGIFLLTGALAARIMPGARPSFYMEMPALRLPRPGNILVKTYSRMVWYFKEVLPIFMLASVLLWLGKLTHVFQAILRLLTPVLRLLGLPEAAAPAFLFGFFRRDYGAAGLHDLQARQLLDGNQITVAAITMTLFLPCVAQFLVMCKERGTRLTLAVSAGILLVSFLSGWLVHNMLQWLGITL